VLAGDTDTTVEMNESEYWANAIPGATLRVIKGGGHAFLLTRRLQSIPVLVSHLTAALSEPGKYD